MTDTVLQWREYPEHVSHSQVKAIYGCGEQFRLERGYGLGKPPRWATTGGSGFHTGSQYLDEVLVLGDSVTEFWDERERDRVASLAEKAVRNPTDQSIYTPLDAQREDTSDESEKRAAELRAREPELVQEVQALSVLAASESPERDQDPSDVFTALWNASLQLSLDEDMLMLLRKRPEQADEALWRNSRKGKAGKAWPAGEGRSWWDHFGPRMLSNYWHWRQTSGWRPAFIGSRPAIEMDASGFLGSVEVKAYIDRVEINPDWDPPQAEIVDIKSGASIPTDAEQLGVYATMLEVMGLPRPRWGRYFDARKCVLKEPMDLSEFTYEYFAWRYDNAKRDRDSVNLHPNTDYAYCRSCEVAEWCRAKKGPLAHQVPLPWVEARERAEQRLAITSDEDTLVQAPILKVA